MVNRLSSLLFSSSISKDDYKRGQALLIVVLVIVVALTVGLSISLRTTTNLRIANESESSERAFTAAEAGIERALVSNTSIPNTAFENDTSYQTDVTTLSGAAFNLNNGFIVRKDQSVDVWLSNYPDYSSPWSGNLDVNWGRAGDTCSPSESSNTQAALEVVVISGTLVNPLSSSYLLDPCSPRSSNNNFNFISTAGDTFGGRTYAQKYTIPVNSGLVMRIIPLYAETFIGVQKGAPDPNLPGQGTLITSTGTAENTTRKIVSFRGHPTLPTELFPFVFFVPK
jgi:hypothetical protein